MAMQNKYTLRQTADALGVKVRTVREWIKTGKIRAEKSPNGWTWLIPEEEVIRYADKN